MPFTKMHGAGNDYIYINAMERDIPDPERLARLMSPRHVSVGSDGIVLICPSERADVRMRIFNADGSEGKMCGNALRCVALYLREKGLVKKTALSVETASGIRRVWIHCFQGERDLYSSMGRPVFYDLDGKESEKAVASYLSVGGWGNWRVFLVSMGNPHAVLFVEDPTLVSLSKIGPAIEHHRAFPDGVNVEFVGREADGSFRVRVWERGSGETLACGTGACAVAAVALSRRYADAGKPVIIRMPGGTLTVTAGQNGKLFLHGPAETVYEGIWEYEGEDDDNK
ncbi:MAG: diaminopimelate epimerase [Ruminococcus sp.]|nr:diaminopimelate epimerase [Candidatus Apopatosoma intestinale]